ncbi:MAG: polysaccharide deacetylase family protein [Bacillota bacterium]|nr:polysaccharide deacetylase family protein [Bacillota bacterium]
MEGTYDRRKRIRRLKKMIVGTIIVMVVIPVIASIILGIRVCSLQKEVMGLKEELTATRKQLESSEETGIYTTATVETSSRDIPEAAELAQEPEEDYSMYDKRIYLTFDDGPSRNTDKILDILKEYDVKATFFVVGKTDEESVRAYQRIVAEGHTLAMHSYSHKYSEIYASKESFEQDLRQLQEYLYQITGVWPRFYRFPGGSSNTVSKVDMKELIEYLNESGITYFDWNIASGDAISGQLGKDIIVNNCIGGIKAKQECMILMHDASDKNSTVEALSLLIEQVRSSENAVFLPITDETTAVQHRKAE